MIPKPLRELPWRLRYRAGPAAGTWLRKQAVILAHPGAEVRFAGPVTLGPGFSLHLPGRGEFIVGPGVEFRRDFRAEVSGGGRIVIGAGTTFTYGCVIQCSTLIEIGERCKFAHATMIVDGNHRFRDPDRPILEQGYDYRPIRIGDDVAVMAKATIIASVGTHSFVGANSVVTRDIPPYSLAAGVPARVIESLDRAGSGDRATPPEPSRLPE